MNRAGQTLLSVLAAIIRSRGVAIMILAFVGFFGYSSVEYNGKFQLGDWRQHLRADAAGYYIYLPGLFHHGMRAAEVPDSLVTIAGEGFLLDREHDRIITKYTYGTALLQLPFYLAAECITGWGRTNGWSMTHRAAIEFGAIVYWTAGLALLASALSMLWPASRSVKLLVLIAVAFGTHTFYYAFRSPAYSHVYSFFLVSLALYAIARLAQAGPRPVWGFVFAFACCLLVLIRPQDLIAAIALGLILFMRIPDARHWRMLYISIAIAAVILAIPQLMYWKFVHGHWLVYSYGDEGFSRWASPKLASVLMSPVNGLLPHAPAFFLLLPALVYLFFTEKRLALLLLFVFAVTIYSCAAWHAWHFGCSYGMRPLVQYTPLLAITLWRLFSWLQERQKAVWHGAVPLLVLAFFVNYRVMLQYEGCRPEHEWDWRPYERDMIEAFFGRSVCVLPETASDIEATA